MALSRILSAALLLTAYFTVTADTVTDLETATRGAHRSAENVARDVWRHPLETLQFFGISNDMTVVEIWPGGGGWYTEILAPYLRDNGKLLAANYDGSTGVQYFAKNAQKFRDKLAANSQVYDKVTVGALMPASPLDEADVGTADVVVTFRNLHNWVRADYHAAMFESMYAMLKPGGVLGLVAHRGNSDMVGVEWARKGYVPQAQAIRIAEAAGFTFVEGSEINANPKDTKHYPDGVWTLPPSYRAGEPEKYDVIGESDRMTLKFLKTP